MIMEGSHRQRVVNCNGSIRLGAKRASSAPIHAYVGGTRTCVHTPSEPLSPKEMTRERVEAALEGATLVYFDGCLTEAALVVAKAARAKGVKVLQSSSIPSLHI